MSYNAKCDKECPTTMPGPRLHNKHFMTNLLAHKQAGKICYKTRHSSKPTPFLQNHKHTVSMIKSNYPFPKISAVLDA
jgi:hypothetical protein